MLNKYSEAIRGNLTKIMRLKFVALVTVEVHARDVIERLYKSGLIDVTSFEWLSQLRLYWEKVRAMRWNGGRASRWAVGGEKWGEGGCFSSLRSGRGSAAALSLPTRTGHMARPQLGILELRFPLLFVVRNGRRAWGG